MTAFTRQIIAVAVFSGVVFASPADAHARRHHRASLDANGAVAAYLPHPSGCPSRAFCGCGASVRVFGRSVRSLWPASAWYRFPRTSPSRGMAAVRNHHVMILESHVGGNVWTVTDYNSGGHRSRVHERSIAGYTIVNPLAGRSASL